MNREEARLTSLACVTPLLCAYKSSDSAVVVTVPSQRQTAAGASASVDDGTGAASNMLGVHAMCPSVLRGIDSSIPCIHTDWANVTLPWHLRRGEIT